MKKAQIVSFALFFAPSHSTFSNFGRKNALKAMKYLSRTWLRTISAFKMHPPHCKTNSRQVSRVPNVKTSFNKTSQKLRSTKASNKIPILRTSTTLLARF